MKEEKMGKVNPKVQSAGIGGAVATVVIFAAEQLGLSIPGEVGAAIATIVAFAAGYLKPA